MIYSLFYNNQYIIKNIKEKAIKSKIKKIKTKAIANTLKELKTMGMGQPVSLLARGIVIDRALHIAQTQSGMRGLLWHKSLQIESKLRGSRR